MSRRDITSEVVSRQIGLNSFLLLWNGAPIGDCLQFGGRFNFTDKRFSVEMEKLKIGRTARIYFEDENKQEGQNG